MLWKENNEWVIKYNGAIEDNEADPYKVNNKYVADAVDVLLNGNDIKKSRDKIDSLSDKIQE